MRIIHFDAKERKGKILPENLEDLWHLSKIINPGDIIIGSTERRWKPPGSKGSGEKKKVTIELSSEKIELHKHANVLRVTGKILAGKPEEYIDIGSYHTIDVVPRISFILKKDVWTEYEKSRLKEAEKSSRRQIVKIIVIDDKQANIMTLKGYGIDFEFEINSRTSKRDEKYTEMMKKYFSEIEKIIKDSKRIIVAGPGFTKNSFKDYLKDKNPKLLKSIFFEHTSTAERSGVYELMKSGVIKKVLKEEKISLEFENIENFLVELKKESGLAIYGMNEIKEAIEYGALKELLILDEIARKNPSILDDARAKKIDIVLFTSEEEPYKKLKSFGGIAGILRFKIK